LGYYSIVRGHQHERRATERAQADRRPETKVRRAAGVSTSRGRPLSEVRTPVSHVQQQCEVKRGWVFCFGVVSLLVHLQAAPSLPGGHWSSRFTSSWPGDNLCKRNFCGTNVSSWIFGSHEKYAESCATICVAHLSYTEHEDNQLPACSSAQLGQITVNFEGEAMLLNCRDSCSLAQAYLFGHNKQRHKFGW